jgi:hypothetical protein
MFRPRGVAIPSNGKGADYDTGHLPLAFRGPGLAACLYSARETNSSAEFRAAGERDGLR